MSSPSWGRRALAGLSVLAILVWLPWWLFAGLLAGSDHSACADSFSADLSDSLSYVGLAVAVGALVEAFRSDRRGIGWALLALYAVALAASVAISLTCGEDEGSDDIAGGLGGGSVTDIPALRSCLKTAGARLATSAGDLRFTQEATWEFHEGKLPNDDAVHLVENVGSRPYWLVYSFARGMQTFGVEAIIEKPERAALVAWIDPRRSDAVEDAEDCLPGMRRI